MRSTLTLNGGIAYCSKYELKKSLKLVIIFFDGFYFHFTALE